MKYYKEHIVDYKNDLNHSDVNFKNIKEVLLKKNNINKMFFNTFRIYYVLVFLLMPFVINLIFNIIFHFNPALINQQMVYENPANLSNEARQYVQLYFWFSCLLGFVEIIFIFHMLVRFRSYAVKSGAIILPIFSFLMIFLLPICIIQIVGLFNIDTIAQNTIINFIQIFIYIIILFIFFQCCKNSSWRNINAFKLKKNKLKNNWTYFLLKRECYDIIKPIAIFILGMGFFYIVQILTSYFINSNVPYLEHSKILNIGLFNTSENQQSINDDFKNTPGKILLPFLIIIFAPIMEEIATRQSPILSTNADIENNNYLKYGNFNVESINKLSNKNKTWLFAVIILSIIYFANMHVMFSNIKDIVSYIFPSIVLTVIFVLGNFNANYSISIHSATNFVSLMIMIASHN